LKQPAMHVHRSSTILLFAAACSLAATTVLSAENTAAIADYQPGTPFTYLFDSGSRSARPLSPNVLAATRGWTLVPEDDTEHEFQGDAVLTNDKLTVVLRAKGPGAEVYSQAAGGAKFRAVVMSAPRKAVAVTGISSLRIVENSPGAVMVEADFQGDAQSGTCTASYRLTTGQAMLEMTGSSAADRFFVWSVTRYVVVPDFFADDMVFSAATCDLNRFGLPAENFLLNLLDDGNAMLTCVWRSPNRDAYAVLTGEGPDRAIRGCEFAGGEDETLWVALLEQPDIWHEGRLTPERDNFADWQPPFDATWRVDCFSAFGLSKSLKMSKPEMEGAMRLAADLARQHRAANVQYTVIPPSAEYIPMFVQMRVPVVLYPLDRNAATPLTTFCPIDVLRNTLGVGPCQYILRAEGLASDANPTRANVMDWVEKQFDNGRATESADQIRERLGQMVAHMEHVQARVEGYGALVRDLQSLLVAEQGNQQLPGTVETLTSILSDMERVVALNRPQPEPAARASELAEQVIGLIGNDNPVEECRRLGDELRRIGAIQDWTLSRCRMLLRWLRQQARMSAIREPESAGLAREVQRRVEGFLAEK
jgi:hypothetical protein